MLHFPIHDNFLFFLVIGDTDILQSSGQSHGTVSLSLCWPRASLALEEYSKGVIVPFTVCHAGKHMALRNVLTGDIDP